MHDLFHQMMGYLLFIMAVIWLLVVSKFFKILKDEYPDDYKNLGSPGVISNNTPSTNKKFLVFLFSGRSLLMDKKIRRFVIFMRLWLVFLIAAFIVAFSE